MSKRVREGEWEGVGKRGLVKNSASYLLIDDSFFATYFWQSRIGGIFLVQAKKVFNILFCWRLEPAMFPSFYKKAQSSNQMLDQLSPMRRWTFQVELPFWQRNKIIIEAETASITTNMSRLEKKKKFELKPTFCSQSGKWQMPLPTTYLRRRRGVAITAYNVLQK